MPIQRREWSIFNTQTIDKIASSITEYDEGLNQLKVFNRLTKNGTVQTIQMDGSGNLYVNATWIATGILADKTAKNAWNLDTGALSMTQGSITLGTSGQKPYFHVATTGAIEWDLANSSMTSTGVMTLKGATLTGGSLTTENGVYKNEVKDGYVYHYYNGTYFGKTGTSIFVQDKKGMMFDIGYDADYGGFAVQETSGENAKLAFYYDRAGDQFISAKDLYMQSNTLTVANIDGNQQLNLDATQFNFTTGNVYCEENLYVNGSKQVATVEQLTNHINDMTNNVLPQYATKTWVQQQGYITSTSGLATQSWVQQQGYLTSSSLSGYATQNWVQSQLSNYVDEQNALYHISGNALALVVDGSNEYTRVNLDKTKWYYATSTWEGRTGTVNIYNSNGTSASLKFYHGVLIAGMGTAWTS